uniref:transmembrane protein 238-like n=1 Tax=Semicossyphus pulcher TaxID=241346 RepID=UPI0037E78587
MERVKCIGGCVPLFLMALVFDIIGLVLVFIGIFANLRIEGRFYGDFLIYTGALIVFFSLGPWLMWYVGNVQVSEDDGSKKRKSTIARLARKLSERLSQKLKGEEGVKCVREKDEEEDGSQVGSPPHKASRVTWGRSTAYHNGGYDDSLDSADVEKKAEAEKDDSNLHI